MTFLELALAVVVGAFGGSFIGYVIDKVIDKRLDSGLGFCPVCNDSRDGGLMVTCHEQLDGTQYTCSRLLYHKGDHCAHEGGRRVASWPKEGQR